MEPCIIWQGCADRHGYGKVNGRKTSVWLAHRKIYIDTKGPIPEGMTLDHLCCNKLCVNPNHLEPVTREENNRRAAKNRILPEKCKRGHSYDGSKWTSGFRYCRECKKEANKSYYRNRGSHA